MNKEKNLELDEDYSNEREKYHTVIINEENNSLLKNEKEENNSQKKIKTPKKAKKIKQKKIKNNRKKNNSDKSSHDEDDIKNDDLNSNSIEQKDNLINEYENKDKTNEDHFEFKEADFEQKFNEFFFDEKGNIKYKNNDRDLEIMVDYYISLLEKKIDPQRIKSLKRIYVDNLISLHKMRTIESTMIKNKMKKIEEIIYNKMKINI